MTGTQEQFQVWSRVVPSSRWVPFSAGSEEHCWRRVREYVAARERAHPNGPPLEYCVLPFGEQPVMKLAG